VWSSPLPRAQETAERIARPLGLAVHLDEGLTEVDYGSWEGCSFADLIADPAYHEYHRDPERSAIPGGGESLAAVRERICNALARVAVASPGACTIVVSHGDPIRLVIAACLGLSVAEMRRLRVDNGAVSGIELTGDWAEVKFANLRSDLAGILRPAEDGARAVLSPSTPR
jgi:probable phosphoglycerate mutase